MHSQTSHFGLISEHFLFLVFNKVKHSHERLTTRREEPQETTIINREQLLALVLGKRIIQKRVRGH